MNPATERSGEEELKSRQSEITRICVGIAEREVAKRLSARPGAPSRADYLVNTSCCTLSFSYAADLTMESWTSLVEGTPNPVSSSSARGDASSRAQIHSESAKLQTLTGYPACTARDLAAKCVFAFYFQLTLASPSRRPVPLPDPRVGMRSLTRACQHARTASRQPFPPDRWPRCQSPASCCLAALRRQSGRPSPDRGCR